MEGMVEENGSAGGAGAEQLGGGGAPALPAPASLVQITVPAQAPSAQVPLLFIPHFYQTIKKHVASKTV